MKVPKHTLLALSVGLVYAATVGAHTELDHGGDEDIHDHDTLLVRPDPASALSHHDSVTSDFATAGPAKTIQKNLVVSGRGERNVSDATTDVWTHAGYAYTGTFNQPCGGDPEAGIWVWDVSNNNKPSFVTVIESPEGSRTNDVKAAQMNSGDILVHSNEACAGGPGGFEIYNVDDPTAPVHLSSVQTDDANAVLRDTFGSVDVGVHNLFLFTQGEQDYVAAVTEGYFGNFQVFDITDPTSPALVAAWGAEELCPLAQCSADPQNETDIGTLIDTINLWMFDGFGSSQNRFLHDITISEDGTQAYLSNWDAGLVLLDISDLDNLQLISVAIDPVNGSLDGEVNSHNAWPSEDGRIVVETEEDFAAWERTTPPGNLTFGEDDPATPLPGVAVSTQAGDDFESSQTGNSGTLNATSLEVTAGPLAANTYAAIELSGDQPKLGDVGPISDSIVFIGRACDGDAILNAADIAAGGIAIVRRGACTFREKNFNAAAAGASAVVIANNIEESTPWGGVRIWDYTDPYNPVLASLFDTECSAAIEPGGSCDPNGTYSVHNVIVETTGNRTLAYISWYWEGMLILDVTNPYYPVEVARFIDTTGPNDGMAHDFWGVYKVPNSPWIYGSDRNGGLYIFKELGKGTMKKN